MFLVMLIANFFFFFSSTAIDSTAAAGTMNSGMWIRSTGFDEAWENLSDRARL